MNPNRFDSPILSRREAFLALGTVGLIALLAGCGGGSSSSGTDSQTGRATLTINWPPRDSRLVPVAANSIVIRILQGTQTIASQTVSRSSSGSSDVTFAKLPVGALTVQAEAYPNSDGTGIIQASGTGTLTIAAAQTSTLAVTMHTAITTLALTPSAPTVVVDQGTAVTVSALDSNGNVVLVSSSNISWSISNGAIARVSGSGTSATLTGFSVGTTTLRVTESESNASLSVSITVAATA